MKFINRHAMMTWQRAFLEVTDQASSCIEEEEGCFISRLFPKISTLTTTMTMRMMMMMMSVPETKAFKVKYRTLLFGSA
jgi:hypothetical protein